MIYPDLTCKSPAEADLVMKDSAFLLAYLDSFVDINEFQSNPIKYTIQSF